MAKLPKNGAETWSLNLRNIPVHLHKLFHKKALDSGQGVIEWAVNILKKEAEKEDQPTSKKRTKA